MKRFWILLLILLLLTVSGVLWWKKGLQPANPSDKSEKVFVVKLGAGLKQISNELKESGLIKDPIVFFLLVKKTGMDTRFQAGDFRLSPSSSAFDIADTLTHGTLDVWVTIPEGKRAGEIGDTLKQKIPTFQEDWRKTLQENEGYLFPDTYLVPKDATITQVVSMMRNNFDIKYKTLAGTNSSLTQNQVVILASLIEREAKYASDRPLVASVLLNRIELGMPLQIDATVQYALGYQANERVWWKKSLSLADLKLNSPYNTYTHNNLPPAPISNPGISTLQAVIAPAKTDFIFYISDSTGHNHYAKTLDEHNANIKKYGL